jgi:hypothetical protein
MYGLKVNEDLDPVRSIDQKSIFTKVSFTLGGVAMNFFVA